MEALSFMKFWRANGKARRDIKISDHVNGLSAVLDEVEVKIAEGDDSFFELELSPSVFSLKDKKTGGEKDEEQKSDRIKATPYCVSSTDHFGKNKVIPVEISSKPHSPIALLKSGPKFRAFSFKSTKPVDSDRSTADTTTAADRTGRYDKKENSKSLNVRFMMEDGDVSSFRTTADTMSEDAASSASSTFSSFSSSKRFFSLIKPLYTMTSKKQSNKENSVAMASPASSSQTGTGREKQRNNVTAGIRIVRRHLGKSRSASAAAGTMSPANRVNESLQIQQDGIQSAILHCKRSFHGSRESSLLSRSTSDCSSQEKLSTSSSEDSYMFSRNSSDSLSEKPADSQGGNLN